MTSLESALHRIAADLLRSNADLALIGGLAISVRTEPRFTRDADFAVAAASDDEAEVLIRHLRMRGYEVAAVVGTGSRGTPGHGLATLDWVDWFTMRRVLGPIGDVRRYSEQTAVA